MSTLYLCGAGNGEGVRLALQVNRERRRWDEIVLLDDDPAKRGTRRLGVAVVGGFDELRTADAEEDEVVNLVTRTTAGRASAREKIASYGIRFASLVHPGVDLLGAELGEEVTVYANATVGAECAVGRSCVVLVGAVVGHGSQLGEGCVVAPNAVINARVTLGDRVYVGANATVLPDVRIGEGATIAANTLVVSDVPAGAMALGVPAVIAQRHPDTTSPGATSPDTTSPGAANDPRASYGRDRSEIEADVVDAVCRVLELPDVAHHANFFDLGGTSLAALRLCRDLAERCALPAEPLDVFRFPSVAELVEHLVQCGCTDHQGPSHVASPVIVAAQRRAARRRARTVG